MYLNPRFSYKDVAILGDTLVAQDVYIGGFPTEDTPPPPTPPPYRIGFTADDNLIILDGEYKDFEGQILRDEIGKFCYLRFFGRLHTRSN